MRSDGSVSDSSGEFDIVGEYCECREKRELLKGIRQRNVLSGACLGPLKFV